MDINYWLAREQVELALARAALNPGARSSHQGMADRYRDMVDDYRRAANDRADDRAARADLGTLFTGAVAA